MIKSLFDLNENEFENIIASVGFRNIQMILSQYISGNIEYVISHLNVTQYKYLAVQIVRLTLRQKNSVIFKTFILNTLQLLYSCLQQVFLLNQYRENLAENKKLIDIINDKAKLLAYITEMNKLKNIFPQQIITTTSIKLNPEYKIYIDNYGFPENGIFDATKLAFIYNSLSSNISLTHQEIC